MRNLLDKKFKIIYFKEGRPSVPALFFRLCISSYNHGDKCVQLVNRILSIRDERYNIVICDDYSDENTIRELKTISDSKVTLIQNKSNLGACKNWFKTISSGTGQYILHVLDRDTISINYLPIILVILGKKSVGGGYFGRSMLYPVEGIVKRTQYAICRQGREAFLTMAGVPVHPTGFFIRRTVWEEGNYRKFFYQSEKYGIYPHSYVLGKSAINNDMIFSPIPFYSFTYRGSNKISRFYEKSKKKEYWWMPENTIKTDNRLMYYLSKVSDSSYKEEFICRRFKDALNRATIIYKRVVSSQQEMEHYGLSARYVSGWELLRISVIYKINFLGVLKKMEMNGKEIRKQLQKIWLENVDAILNEIKGNKVNELLNLNNKNFMQFQLMNQWVKAKQYRSNLSGYFEENGYNHIAIYGMGIVGQTLLEELQKTKIEVVYGIDRNAHKTYTEVDVLTPENALPEVDAIVVTVVESFDNVAQNLKGKIDCPIISLMDVIYYM